MTTITLARDEPRSDVGLIAATALLLAAIDGTFAMAFYSAVLHRAVTGAIWRGVATNVLGPAAAHGGASATLVGLAIHLTVATGWTVLFYLGLRTLPALAAAVRQRGTAIVIAAIYGMFIWMCMQLVIVPLGRGKPPVFTSWLFYANLAWHAIAVGPIIVLMLRRAVTRLV